MRRRLLSGVLTFLMLFFLFANSAFAASLLKVGSRGNDVRMMQQKLIELGYLNGKADGIFGSLTREAVIKFQRAKGLAVDGIAGPQTLNALYGTSSPSNGQPPAQNPGTQPSDSIPTRLLKLGSRGDDVKQLQNRLNELGYSCGAADGIFGNATRTAVINFQRANGLAADGIAGPATLGKLFANVPPADQKPPAQNPPVDNPPSSGSPGTQIPITQTLRRGSRGEQVKILQNRLKELGYDAGTADGIFGAKTHNAVIAFQRANGLAADGIVGPKTIAKLYEQAPSPKDPKPADPPKEDESKNDFDEFHGIPGQLTGKTIILDPGHGGWDVGASRNGVYEKDLNLDMAQRLKRMLEEAGATVVMTRNSDEYYSLYYRAAFANKYVLDRELNKKLQEKELLEKEYEEKEKQKQEKQLEKLEKLALIEEGDRLIEENRAKKIQLEIEIGSLSAEKISLEQDYNIKKSQHMQKIVEQQQVLQELDNLKDSLHRLQENKLQLEQRVQDLISQRDQLDPQDKETIAKIESQIAELEGQINQINNEINIAENNIHTKQNRLDALNVELEVTESLEKMAFEALEEVLEELEARESELDKIKEKINSMEKELPNIHDDISRLEKEIFDIERELPLLELEISKAREEADDLKNKRKLFDVYLNNPSLASRTGIYEVNYDNINNKNYINENLKEIFDLTRLNDDSIIFVAIHCNSTADETTNASGIQVYYRDSGPYSSWGTYGVNTDYYKGYNDAKRLRLAQSLLKHTTQNAGFSGSYSSPYKQDFAVLRETNIVSVLMEIGFINNPKDREHLLKAQTRENVAKGMYLGIVEYFGR